jgi:hypothetical protein
MILTRDKDFFDKILHIEFINFKTIINSKEIQINV